MSDINKEDLLKYLNARKFEIKKELIKVLTNNKCYPKYSTREVLTSLNSSIQILDVIIKDISNDDIGIEKLIKRR